MKTTLKLIRVGMNMQEATIAEWFKQPGERFVAEESLYAIETEKVTQDVPAPGPGVMLEILVPRGVEVAVGAALCVVDLEFQR